MGSKAVAAVLCQGRTEPRASADQGGPRRRGSSRCEDSDEHAASLSPPIAISVRACASRRRMLAGCRTSGTGFARAAAAARALGLAATGAARVPRWPDCWVAVCPGPGLYCCGSVGCNMSVWSVSCAAWRVRMCVAKNVQTSVLRIITRPARTRQAYMTTQVIAVVAIPSIWWSAPTHGNAGVDRRCRYRSFDNTGHMPSGAIIFSANC